MSNARVSIVFAEYSKLLAGSVDHRGLRSAVSLSYKTRRLYDLPFWDNY